MPTIVEYLPVSQGAQVLAATAPTFAEYFPALQSMHAFFVHEFIAVRYLPAGHTGHQHCTVLHSLAQEKQH